MDKVVVSETTLVWGLSCLTFVSVANTMVLYSLARLALTGRSGLMKGLWNVQRREDKKASRPDLSAMGSVTGYTQRNR